ncbi:cytochrome-c peroxidase [Thalassotalea euphylliae]|nr:cytochrome c peroxidase [Thalassotalea euphylliae]
MSTIKRVITTICLAIALATVIGCEQQPRYWTVQERALLASFQLNKLSPSDASSNRFAVNPAAVAFGKQLFFDKRLSLDGSMSCASCHQPDLAFTDGLDKAQGVNRTGRNTQTLLGVQYASWFYWDGRKDSLWAQALVPFEAADEMASSRVQVLKIVAQDAQYRRAYEALFGALPELIFSGAIPEKAGPWGDSETKDNWYRLSTTNQRVINQAYANIGKAVAAFERTIELPNTRFDDYLQVLFIDGWQEANRRLSDSALAGVKLFLNQEKTHCLRCHNGPLLTNQDFHNIGTGNFTGIELDFGRYFGIPAVLQDEFNCLGPYSDAQPEQCHGLNFMAKQIHEEAQGAFKTPTLRYLSKTAPYFHDGRFTTLDEVLEHYLAIKPNQTELPELTLTAPEKKQLISFLLLLSE